MKIKKFHYSLLLMTAMTIFAWRAMATQNPVSALSDEFILNTVTFVEDWSAESEIDTKVYPCTMILIR